MKKIALMILLIVGMIGTGFATKDTRLLRFPDINGDLVTFVYAGDIWTVSAKGGEAKRLTSHRGLELFPKISPDRKWIAFSAEYSGSRQVYVMPVNGGIPKQLTYYNDVGRMPPRGGYDYIVMDWTPDSKEVLVRANRTPYGERKGKYFLVSLKGGLEKPLQIPEVGFGSFSPDGNKICYTIIAREFRTWKRYKGGMAHDVWIYDLKNDRSKRVTTFAGTDHHPLWYKDKIYFVSDRDLIMNVYSYDLKTEKLKKLTHYQEYDVLWPSGHDGDIVFENGGFLFKLDLQSGNTDKIKVDIHFDNPNRLPYFKNVSKFVSRFGYTVSPTGKRAVFDARGDIFTVPAKEGITYNLTRTQGVRETYPRWSPDGKYIAYYSDQTGEYEIYLIDPKGKNKPIQLTTNSRIWRYSMIWSPDSTKILYSDKNQRLQYLDIKTRKITVIDKASNYDIRDYGWSPDSKWVVYDKNGKSSQNAVWVYSILKNKVFQLTDDMYQDFSPVFSKCGKYIFFMSNRDFKMNFSDFEWDYVFNKATRIYAMALSKTTGTLFPDKNDEEKVKNPEIKENKKKKGKKEVKKPAFVVKIDMDGINDRIFDFPMKADDYGGLEAIEGGILYAKDGDVYTFSIKDKKKKLIIKGITGGEISANGKKMLYRAKGKYGIIDIKPGQKVGDGKLNLSDVTVKIDPVKEWNQIYTDGWRTYRDWFYVKNMHGVDWKKMREKYAKLLPFLSHRADLDYIFGELVGELNAGHCYVNWGDFERVKRMNTGLLGAELKADEEAKRYKIIKIYRGENWNKRMKSPLTELGIHVKEGDYIIRLNGYDVTTADNPYRFLENTVGKRIPIVVNSKPVMEGSRTYLVKPVASELQLFHLDWVRTRREMVDKLSGGRIGYIYVPNTAVSGNRELYKGMYAFRHKEALIIDERYNGGGWNPVKMVEILSRKILNYWGRKGLKLRPTPDVAVDGPKVMLMNYNSASGGDDFPYLFKKRKLGKLIGTRTWGGLIGYGWSPGMADGARFAIPQSGIVGTNGEWVVEGIGVYPDIEVIDRPEAIAKGQDPCIEKAVEVLLEELKKKGVKKVKKPADPDRSKWHEKEIK